MAEESEYGKLLLSELKRLSDSQEKLRNDFEKNFHEINIKLNDIKTIEKETNINSSWIDKVNEVWSPTQMKEAKDEIYKQKIILHSAIAIITFVQIIVGVAVLIWGKF